MCVPVCEYACVCAYVCVRGKGATQQCRIHHSSGRPLLNTEDAPLKPVAPPPGAVAPPSGQVALPPGQEWFCVLENMDLYTLYQIKVTAVNPLGRSTQLLSRAMEDISNDDITHASVRIKY